MIPAKIDWHILAKTIDYYQNWGYTRIEVPWIVPTEIKNITYAGKCFDEPVSGYSLVGSAEQSFLYLDSLGKLSNGKYIACTPCFRMLDNDTTHDQYFMKVELYVVHDNITGHDLNTMIKQAKDYFNSNIGEAAVDIVSTNAGYDIDLNGIEIGSYGIGNHNGRKWVYGTAIAEPRFSYAKSLTK